MLLHWCCPLTTLYTHGVIEFSKTLISNHFLIGLWISKKNVKTYLYVKKSQLFEKILFFRSQCKKVLKIEF